MSTNKVAGKTRVAGEVTVGSAGPQSDRSDLRKGRLAFLTILSLLTMVLPAHTDGKTPKRKTEIAQQPESAAQARKEIQAVYDQQSAALVSKDVNAFLALCTPDYQDIKIGNQIRPAGMIRQSLPQTLSRYANFKMTAAIKTFQLKGARATATATRHIDVTLLPNYAGKNAVRRSDTVTQDVWVKTAKGWRTKSSKEIAYKKL